MNSNKKYIFKILTPEGSGTGFMIDGVDFIVTNHHVISGFKQVAVEDSEQNRYLAQVIMINSAKDIAFLECADFKDIKSDIKIDLEVEISSGNEVFALGYPYGLPFTITKGIISSTKHIMNEQEFIQIDAAINPGNSGGPIVDVNSNLIAISTSKFSDADNIGFGIPTKELKKEIDGYKFDEIKFRVKCDSCENYMDKKVSYCENCGADIDKSLFSEKEASYLTNYINDMLLKSKLNPVLCVEGDEYWRFYYEDCSIRIFNSGDDRVYMTSPLNSMPKNNLKELLEYITNDTHEPFEFGVSDNVIYISYRIHKNDIYVKTQEKRIKENMQNFLNMAKEMQEKLLNEYNCEKSPESK